MLHNAGRLLSFTVLKGRVTPPSVNRESAETEHVHVLEDLNCPLCTALEVANICPIYIGLERFCSNVLPADILPRSNVLRGLFKTLGAPVGSKSEAGGDLGRPGDH